WLAWHFLHPPDVQTGSPPPIGPNVSAAPIPLGPQPRFRDVTAELGISFTYVNGATTMEKKLLPEIMGGGVAFIDYDKSGNQSILFINSCYWPGTEPSGKPRPTMKLFRNKGDGTFEDVTEKTGLDKISFYGMGVTVGDYDNDGYPDIFISGVGDHRLLHNEGGHKFVDITAKAGDLAQRGGWPEKDKLPDGDGQLDLFVCCYVSWSPAIDLAIKNDPFGFGRVYPGPKQYSGTQCLLYHNEGGGVFKDVSEAANIHVFEQKQAIGKSLGVSA